jgi:hypothetical protein
MQKPYTGKKFGGGNFCAKKSIIKGVKCTKICNFRLKYCIFSAGGAKIIMFLATKVLKFVIFETEKMNILKNIGPNFLRKNG